MDPANCSKVDLAFTLPEDLKGVVRCFQLAIVNAAAAPNGRRRNVLFSLDGHDALLLVLLKVMLMKMCLKVSARRGCLQQRRSGY